MREQAQSFDPIRHHKGESAMNAQIATANAHREEIDRLKAELSASTAALAAANEALRFYADTSDYVSPLTGGTGKLYFDCGEKARRALAASNPNRP
jgi:hypothetical protein